VRIYVGVDMIDVHEITREARSKLGAVPREMKRTLDRVAREERRTHKYQNRTRYLEESTFASEASEGSDEVSVEFGARTHYASYLADKWLSRVRELAAQAETELEYHFEGDAEALGNM
jgi:DNA topoisomerase VI subunit B